jgi:hypothetical protein
VRFDQVPERDEILTRFIFSSKHFSSVRVKPDAFLPSSDMLETSVFRTVGMDAPGIRERGTLVGEAGGRSLKAWADVLAEVVFDAGLDVPPDNVPERHAANIGWPREKDHQISLAQQLAARATLSL